MLAAQVTTSPLFKQHCAGCHGSASEFARKSLTLQGGVLTGKASGKPVADYLRSHGGLPPTEIAPMVKTLERVLGEVGG
jgi:mono/diheme cytochrome c family protein